MTQVHLTVDTEIIKKLYMPGGQEHALAKLLEQILNQVLQSEVTEQIGADPYARTKERQAYRNGSYERGLNTRIGSITLQVPKVRNGTFTTSLFLAYQRSEQALILAMMEMVIQGVSTRKITEVTELLCGTEFSKSTISELCKNLDPIVETFRNRPLDNHYPFIVVDAIYTKAREDQRIRQKGVLIATGINSKGYREVIGFTVADSESEDSWNDFFKDLKARGLQNVDVVISDNHGGLKNAISKQFQNASWQRCQTHFSRNMLDKTPKKVQPELKIALKDMYTAPDIKEARKRKEQIILNFSKTAPKAVELLEKSFDEITTIFALPEYYRKRLRTSNSIERLNEEIRRRERVIRIFPNEQSIIRIIGAVLIEQHEKWVSSKKYFDMEEYYDQLEQQEQQKKRQAEKQDQSMNDQLLKIDVA